MLLNLYQTCLNAQLQFALDDAIFEEAARLRALHKSLKTPDAIHLAAALQNGCTEFWTNDDRLSTSAPGMAVKAT